MAPANPLPHTSAITMPFIAAVLLLALPWLNPKSLGPTPAIPTLLFAWGCSALFLIGCAIPGQSRAGRLVRVCVGAWLLAALVSALIGVLQYFGLSGSLGQLRGLGYVSWALEHLGVSGGLDSLVNVTSVGEAFGNLRQRNHFATLTNIGLASVIFCSASLGDSGVRASHSPRYHVLGLWLVMAAILLAAANAASSSRTGLMQLILITTMAGLWGFRMRRGAGTDMALVRNVLVAADLAYVAAALSFPWLASLDPEAIGILARLHENGAACSGRLTLWSNVLHLIAQKPWFGWGWGELGYAHFITLYPGERFCDILDNAHDLPLHLAVELGVPFALVFCGACIAIVWRAKPWRETNRVRQLAWTVLAAIGLHSLLEYPLWYGPFQMATVLSLWLLYSTPADWMGSAEAMSSDVVQGDAAVRARLWPLWLAFFGILILGFCTYAAWDYWRISQIYTLPAERAVAYQGDTLEKIRGSRLFQNQVRFAELGTTVLTAQNAEHNFALAKDLLHFSAEPQVAQRIVESAMLLGRNEDAQYYLLRFEAAFPQAHANWTRAMSASEPQ